MTLRRRSTRAEFGCVAKRKSWFPSCFQTNLLHLALGIGFEKARCSAPGVATRSASSRGRGICVNLSVWWGEAPFWSYARAPTKCSFKTQTRGSARPSDLQDQVTLPTSILRSRLKADREPRPTKLLRPTLKLTPMPRPREGSASTGRDPIGLASEAALHGLDRVSANYPLRFPVKPRSDVFHDLLKRVRVGVFGDVAYVRRG
jgi:hypothetical protein